MFTSRTWWISVTGRTLSRENTSKSMKCLQSVLSLGRLCSELVSSYSWPAGGSPRLPRGKRVIECSIANFVSTVAVTKHGIAPSIESSPAKGNLEQRTDVGDTMLELVTEFKEGSAPSSMSPAGGNPMRRVEEKTL